MSELLGLAILLLIAAIATIVILSGVIAYDAIHPPRRTAGYAIAHGLPADPGDMGLAFESWTLDMPRDVTLPVWEIAAGGSGPTVVIVHGWGESRIEMLTRIGAWLDHADRVVLYDRRGHGDATGGTARLGTDEHLDLLSLLGRLGDGPLVLVGHGTGVPVAFAAAAGNAAVQRVVAEDPLAGDVHTAIQDRLRDRGFPARPLTDVAMLWLRIVGIRSGPGRRDLPAPASQVP